MEKEFKILKTVLQESAAREKYGVEIRKRGQKVVFMSDEERELKNCIVNVTTFSLLGKLLRTRRISVKRKWLKRSSIIRI